MNRKVFRIGLSVAATAALGLSLFFAVDLISTRPGMAQEAEEGEADEAILLPEWASIELVDAVTGESFTIADFAGKPILVESFAVWCPICLRQQREMAKLLELEGDSIVHVSLDTDPNEDVVAVRLHAEEHGFTWLFAVAPVEMTQRLINEFGLIVANPPSAPVILIDVSGSARLLPRGVKSAEDLLEEIAGTG